MCRLGILWGPENLRGQRIPVEATANQTARHIARRTSHVYCCTRIAVEAHWLTDCTCSLVAIVPCSSMPDRACICKAVWSVFTALAARRLTCCYRLDESWRSTGRCSAIFRWKSLLRAKHDRKFAGLCLPWQLETLFLDACIRHFCFLWSIK